MTWTTVLRRVSVSALLAVVCVLLLASPGSAHAELVSTSPANGERLDTAPQQITLTFSESVDLLDGGIRLLDPKGTTVPTPDPAVDGHTVTWAMPARLPDGAYVVTWRVISADGHPIDGAFSFGIGAVATVLPGAVSNPESKASTAPLHVVVIRLAGYLAFAVVAGVIAFLVWCSPGRVGDPVLQRLTRWALSVGLVATAVGMLVEGPYTAGESPLRLFDPRLLSNTLRTPWGVAMAWRFAMLLMLTALIWRLRGLADRTIRWIAITLVVVAAGAIAAAGHGASSGKFLDLGVVTLHVLTAGIWVGGLVALVALGRTVDKEAIRRFSTLALTAVVVLVATGVLNSLRNLHSVDDLFLTRYGALLLVKLALIAVTLGAAAVSRTWVRRGRLPGGSVRIEAALTVCVLTVTAFLSMTSPPPKVTLAAPVECRRRGTAQRPRRDVARSPGHRGAGDHPRHHRRKPPQPAAHRPLRSATAGDPGRAQGQQRRARDRRHRRTDDAPQRRVERALPLPLHRRVEGRAHRARPQCHCGRHRRHVHDHRVISAPTEIRAAVSRTTSSSTSMPGSRRRSVASRIS